MSIQWYPGHMHKAQKEIRQTLAKVDLVIELLDARIPFSSENPMLANIRGDKPCIKILNKSDLADPDKTLLWQSHFEQERNVKTLATSAHENAKVNQIPEICKKLVPERAQSVKKIRALIMGIPNVGKSTLINALAGRTIAKTGNEPAVTKRQQQVHIGEDLLLFDTPGVLWPKQEYEKSSYRLAVTGAIKDTALEYDDIAFFAVETLLRQNPERLRERYELDDLPETDLEFLEVIGRMRGCLGSGGRVDLKKVSQLFIHDYRSGGLGRITWETPEDVATEKLEQEKINEEKEKLKQDRLHKFKKGRK